MSHEKLREAISTAEDAGVKLKSVEDELAALETKEGVGKDEIKAKKSEVKAAKKVFTASHKALTKERIRVERETNRQPKENGIRRPKPETKSGRVWAIADQLSEQIGGPTPIRQLLIEAKNEGLNEGNVKAEYARWRKFNGISGRITAPKSVEQ